MLNSAVLMKKKRRVSQAATKHTELRAPEKMTPPRRQEGDADITPTLEKMGPYP